MSEKSPTARQVRFHYGRLARLRYKMIHALNDAHNAGVIQYENYSEESPCKMHSEMWERVLKATEKQLAAAMREEITRGNE